LTERASSKTEKKTEEKASKEASTSINMVVPRRISEGRTEEVIPAVQKKKRFDGFSTQKGGYPLQRKQRSVARGEREECASVAFSETAKTLLQSERILSFISKGGGRKRGGEE